MRKILDKLFENKKLSMLIPIIAAAVAYLLFVLFGKGEDKWELVIITPIICAFWYFGVFFIVFMQVKNPRRPEWFLNFFELMAAVTFTVFGFIDAISFVLSGFQNFSPTICAGIVTYSSISWVHGKREKITDKE